MENKILTYDSVEISFDGEAVVHDVSFSLTPGEILGLVGESGSGKSTLIKAAMGLLGSGGLVTRGDICYMGQNILDISEKEKRKIRGAGSGMVFEDGGASRGHSGGLRLRSSAPFHGRAGDFARFTAISGATDVRRLYAERPVQSPLF